MADEETRLATAEFRADGSGLADPGRGSVAVDRGDAHTPFLTATVAMPEW